MAEEVRERGQEEEFGPAGTGAALAGRVFVNKATLERGDFVIVVLT